MHIATNTNNIMRTTLHISESKLTCASDIGVFESTNVCAKQNRSCCTAPHKYCAANSDSSTLIRAHAQNDRTNNAQETENDQFSNNNR